MGGSRVTREALVENEKVLAITMEHVGTRVGVDTLALHVRSLYELMGVLVNGF